MATFVLVHGAWHGGWCWKKVTPLLRAAGHDVYTPTLTGLGERAHLLSPAVDLEMHIRDVLGVLEYEDLRQVVLVGHSYGGMVITGVADRASERLAHLVYLDTWVPGDGSSAFTLLPAERAKGLDDRARSEGDGWRIPPAPLQRFGVTADEDLKWAMPRVVPQPIKTFSQPLRLKNPSVSLPRTYIWCAQYDGFRAFAERVRSDPNWVYCELATGHDAMITMPRELTELFLETVQRA